MASFSSPSGVGDGVNTPISSISAKEETNTPPMAETPTPAAMAEEEETKTAAAVVVSTPSVERDFPPGYRFVPTDEELIVKYLKPKIREEPIPIKEMIEVDLANYDPQVLSESYPRIGDHEWYFFTPRKRKYPNGQRPNRAAGQGYWKATGADKMVTDAENNCVGYRKALVFYRGKPPHGEKTHWIMHEYRMDQPSRVKEDPSDMRLDDSVLCRIYTKPLRQNQNQEDNDNANAVAGDNHVAEEQPAENHNVAPFLNNVPENIENPGPVLLDMPQNVEHVSDYESILAQSFLVDPSYASLCDVPDYDFGPLIDNPLGLRNWSYPQDYSSANWGIQNSYVPTASTSALTSVDSFLGSSASTSVDSFLLGPLTSGFQDSVIKFEDRSPDDVEAGKRRRF